MKLKYLSSVGTFINEDTLMTYPAVAAEGTTLQVLPLPDFSNDCGVHIEDCCDEWFSSLSPEDTQTLRDLEDINDCVGAIPLKEIK
jgi:hypothetical protein